MNDLRDAGLCPVPIYAGCHLCVPSAGDLAPPVHGREHPYPEIREMGFFADQHKFSSWVYAASADMLVRIFFSWSLFSHRP